jgi:hypothetical protein
VPASKQRALNELAFSALARSEEDRRVSSTHARERRRFNLLMHVFIEYFLVRSDSI